MKTELVLTLILCGMMQPISAATRQTANTQAATETAPAANPAETATKPRLSYGLEDVVKLTKAGVNEAVILVYLQNSGIAYSLTAQDLIQLQEAGVNATVTAALMQRGEQVKQNAMQAAKQIQTAQAQAAQTTAAQQAAINAATPTYTVPASTVTYIGYPSSYNYVYRYPAYYNYGYYQPRAYYYSSYSSCYSYPRISFGVNFGGFRGSYHHSYRGGYRHCR